MGADGRHLLVEAEHATREPCRKTAEQRGWVLAMVHYFTSRLFAPGAAASRTAVLLLALLASVAAMGQQPADLPDPDVVLLRMEERSAKQNAELKTAEQTRRYHAENQRLHRQATALVAYRYTAPQNKEFTVIGRSGSESVCTRVFRPMFEAERANAVESARQAAEISRRNYDFHFLAVDEADHAYVFTAAPRTGNRFLFRGKVWVDATDYAVLRVEGEPAQRPSFWVRHTHFVQEYGKFGHFWFPLRNRTEVELRLLGHSTFTIDYFDHKWEQAETASPGPTLNTTSVAEVRP